MYTRFYNSVIAPKNLVDFRNDALWKVFLYVLFFALLLSTRVTIDTITYDGLSAADKEAAIQEFSNVDETCVIKDAMLTCDTASSQNVYDGILFKVFTDSNPEIDFEQYNETQYYFVLHQDSLRLVVSQTVLYSIPINDLPSHIHNFDFSTQSSNPDYFYESLFDVYDEYVLGYKNIWGTLLIIVDFLTNFAMFMIFILISSWMLRFRFRVIRFKHLFVMTSYSSTALYLILIINSLYNLSFFLVIILLIIAFRQNSQLSLELYKRLSKKP